MKPSLAQGFGYGPVALNALPRGLFWLSLVCTHSLWVKPKPKEVITRSKLSSKLETGNETGPVLLSQNHFLLPI